MCDIRSVEHLVGIDFGDGETTASVISFDNEGNSKPVRSLNIFDRNTPDKQKVESCIYQKSNGDWEIASIDDHFSMPSLKSNFKNKPSELLRQQKMVQEQGLPECEQKLFQLKTFVKLVFDKIIKNNTCLQYNRETKERNFILVAACPSRWAQDIMTPCLENKEEIMAYKALLNEVIPIDAVIKESDAAFFHFLDQGLFPADGTKSLVIDYGSSTIDYTLFSIENGNKKADSDGSNITDLGASKVEAAIQEHLETTPGKMAVFQNAKNTWKDLCQRYNVSDAFWEPAIRHNLKDAKESYYGANLEGITIHKLLSSIWRGRLTAEEENALMTCYFYHSTLSQSDIEDENTGCLRYYKNKVRAEFFRIAERWSPDHIIITGGASRMPWVEEEVKNAFSYSTRDLSVMVDKDTPSYVVSHGIARYLLAYRKFMLQFDQLEKNLALSYELTDSAIRNHLQNAFNLAVENKYTQKLKAILLDYRNRHVNTSINDLAQTIANFHLNIANSFTQIDFQECNDIITKYLSDKYSSIVSKEINKLFTNSFHIQLSIPVSLPFKNLLGGFVIITGPVVKQLQTILSRSRFFSFPSLIYKAIPRNDDDRDYIASHFPTELNATLTNNSWTNQVVAIRNTVKNSISMLRDQIPFTLYE